MDFTKEEVKYLKSFAQKRIEAEKVEKEATKAVRDFKKEISFGKLKNKRNNPKWVCKKCGKVMVNSWATAMNFPEKKYRCFCNKGEK